NNNTSVNVAEAPSDIPTAPVAATEDIPTVAGTTQPGMAAATGNSELIQVITPVQEVTIDPLGGDIVSLSLPRYPTTLETPDEPFVLMRNDNVGTYVAQHGLIGRDGIDSPARALYTSTSSTYTLNEGQDNLSVDLVHS